MQLIVLLLHLIAFALADGRGYRDHHEGDHREGRRDNYGGHGFERHHRASYGHISEEDLERLEKRLEAEEFGYGRYGHGRQNRHREEKKTGYVPTTGTPETGYVPTQGPVAREPYYHFEGHHFNHYDQEHRYDDRRGYDRMEDDFASFLYGYKPSYGETHEYSKEYKPFYGQYDERYGNSVGHHRLHEEYGYGYIPNEHDYVEKHHGLDFPKPHPHPHPHPTPVPGNETNGNTTDTNTTETDNNETAPVPAPHHKKHDGKEHRHSKYEDLERKYFYKGKHYRQETTDEYGEYLDSDPYYHVYHPKKPHHPPPAPAPVPVPEPEPVPAPEPEPAPAPEPEPAPERPTK